MLDLFGNCGEVSLKNDELQYLILPVSVVDIAAQNKRQNENHDSVSSRANYSPFPDEISTMCVEYFLRDKSNIFDPFAGWGERHAKCVSYGKQYTGFDTSNAAIIKAKELYSVDNIKANSLVDVIPSFDGLVTCPPYWNLERYEGDGIDKCKTWNEFISDYSTILKRCYESAQPDSIFCIMVCDWRSKGIYYDLEFQTCKIFENLGATVHDKVIVSRSKVSKIKIMLPQAKRLGYTVKVHESLLVFKK